MRNYLYYWYHHMMPQEEQEQITQALSNKDYFTFIELYKKCSIKAIEYGKYVSEFQTWFPMIFLPEYIYIEDENGNHIGSASILNKENFEKITYSECKCG